MTHETCWLLLPIGISIHLFLHSCFADVTLCSQQDVAKPPCSALYTHFCLMTVRLVPFNFRKHSKETNSTMVFQDFFLRAKPCTLPELAKKTCPEHQSVAPGFKSHIQQLIFQRFRLYRVRFARISKCRNSFKHRFRLFGQRGEAAYCPIVRIVLVLTSGQGRVKIAP